MNARRPMNRRPLGSILCAAALAAGLLTAAGCHRDMWDQPKAKVLGDSDFFADGRAARHPVAGTVPRGQLHEDEHLYEGTVDGELAQTFPFSITQEVLERGQERYDIFCSPCHGRSGDGLGMIVQRGFQQPLSLHVERLRKAPPGFFYDVITNGIDTVGSPVLLQGGVTFGEGDVVHPVIAKQSTAEDRWSIVAFIRALQLSQHATLEDVPTEERANLFKEGVGEAENEHD